jgi:hypothetical protein
MGQFCNDRVSKQKIWDNKCYVSYITSSFPVGFAKIQLAIYYHSCCFDAKEHTLKRLTLVLMITVSVVTAEVVKKR